MESEYMKKLLEIEKEINDVKEAKKKCMENIREKLKNSKKSFDNCMELMELMESYDKKPQPYVQKIIGEEYKKQKENALKEILEKRNTEQEKKSKKNPKQMHL